MAVMMTFGSKRECDEGSATDEVDDGLDGDVGLLMLEDSTEPSKQVLQYA